MTEQAKKDPVYGRKLRLAIFGGRGIPSTYSGTETFFIELAPRLAERGHDVIVYCRKALFKERPPLYKGVRLIYLPSIETKNLGTFTHTLACMVDVAAAQPGCDAGDERGERFSLRYSQVVPPELRVERGRH